MRKGITILFLFICTFTLHAQETVISFDKMNILYIGIDNPIEFAFDKLDCKNYKLISTEISIKCNDSCKCMATCKSQGYATVLVADKDNVVIDTVNFITRMIPNPWVDINGMQGGRLNVSDIKTFKELSLKYNFFYFDAGFTITSFDLFWQPKNEIPHLIHNKGSIFNKDALKAISKASPGDIYYFEEIKVLGPDNMTRKLPGIAFKVE